MAPVVAAVGRGIVLELLLEGRILDSDEAERRGLVNRVVPDDALDAEAEALWLDPATEDPDRLTSLLRPYPSEEMEAYPVSTIVNSSHDDRPEMIEPIETAPQGGRAGAPPF